MKLSEIQEITKMIYSGIWHRIVWQKFADMSEECNAFMFIVEKAGSLLFLPFDPEDEGNSFLRNFG
jgi:hypothetical protein